MSRELLTSDAAILAVVSLDSDMSPIFLGGGELGERGSFASSKTVPLLLDLESANLSFKRVGNF